MSNYSVTTNFGAKDALTSGDPNKLILGSQLTTEFNAIATAIATKLDAGSGFANPTASIGLTAANGVATTAMRSDAAPALNVGISPTWTGTHTFSGNTLTHSVAGKLTIGPPNSGNPLTVNSSSSASPVIEAVMAGSASCIIRWTSTGNHSYELNAASDANFYLTDKTAVADRLKLTSTGNFTIFAPSSGVALAVSGVSNANVITATASGTGAGVVSNSQILDRYAAAKTISEVRTSTTTLADDSVLSFASIPAGTYIVRMRLAFQAITTAAMGIKWALTGTATVSPSQFNVTGFVNGAAQTNNNLNFGTTVTYATITLNPANDEVDFVGCMVVTAAGSVKLQYAQNSSSGNNLVMLGSSYLELVRVA